jgi:hypothetical protein
MTFVRLGSAVFLAVTAVAATANTATADDDPPPPPMHQVTYTIFTEKPFYAEIYYRDTDPPNFADYSHDPYVFSPNVEAQVGPDNPWVLNVMLANPNQWAMVTATSGQSPNPPNFHCVLAVDGVVMATNAGPKGALCSLRHW